MGLFSGLSIFCLLLAILTSVLYGLGVKESKDPNRNMTEPPYVVRTLKTNRNFMISSWIFCVFFFYIWFSSERHEQAAQKQLNRRLQQIVNR